MRDQSLSPLYTMPALAVIIGLLTAWRLVALALWPYGLFADEAQYWVWSQNLAWGYYSKPPLLAGLIAFTTSWLGHSEFAVRVSAPVLHGLTALIIYGLGRRLFNAAIGFWAAILYSLMPAVTLSALLISTDVPLLFFWAAFAWAFYSAITRGRWYYYAVAGLALGLGLLAKYTMIAILPCALLFAVLQRRHYPQWRLSGVGLLVLLAAVILAPNLYWNATQGWVTIQHVGENVNAGGALFRFDKAAEFIFGQLAVFGPVSLLLWLGAWGRLRSASLGVQYLAWLSIPLLVVMVGQSFLSRAHLNWAGPAYITACIWLSYALAQQPWRRTALTVIVLLHLVPMAAVMLPHSISHLTQQVTGDHPARRLLGYRELGAALTKVWQQSGQPLLVFNDRKYMAWLMYYAPAATRGATMLATHSRPENYFEQTWPWSPSVGGLLVADTASPILPAGVMVLPQQTLRVAGDGFQHQLYLFTVQTDATP